MLKQMISDLRQFKSPISKLKLHSLFIFVIHLICQIMSIYCVYAIIKIRYWEVLTYKMDTFFDNCFQGHQKLIQLKYDPTSINQFTKDPVEQFLNDGAFIHDHNQTHQLLLIKEVCKSETVEEQLESQSQAIDPSPRRKKSIFHNFQKHMITLLKKFIHIDENTVENGPNKQLAQDIWLAFKKTRCFNKKCLHMIFGIASPTAFPQLIQTVPLENSQCRFILSKNSIRDILEVQAFMRQEVVRQASFLSKQLLQEKCQMNRFQEFYQYFQCFMCELSQGPMTKRMTKTRKHIVVQKLMNADNN